jgi:hypothetical protein
MTILFGLVAWLISPGHLARAQPGKVGALQDRFFNRLGIEWFTGPDRSTRDEGGSDSEDG